MLLRRGSVRPFYVYGLVFLFISINQQLYPQWIKLQNTEWSPPQTIPLYNLDAWPPILVADQNRTVHAFSSQLVNEEGSQAYLAVVYNRWTREQGWTAPIDIILSPYKEARVTDVHLDKNGIFHLVFFGGDNTGADIYYSKASAADADDSHAWSVPSIIGENAGDPEGAAFVEDNQGGFHVIYNGRNNGNGVYVVTSKDNGDTWSNPVPIFFTDDQSPLILGIHVIKSESGWLHAIWNTRTEGGQGRGIYYVESKDGNSWSDPILLDSAQSGYGINYPTIYEYDESLFVIYIQTPKIMMRLSRDNGRSWVEPVILFSRYVGVNGSPSLVVDSNQGFHLFFGQRIDPTPTSPAIHGLWHSMWVNNRWTEPEAVVKGPPVTDMVGFKSFDPFEARAVVSQGNVLLVTWRTDPGEKKPNGVWYSYAVLSAPELPMVPFPTTPPLNTQITGGATPTISANSLLSTPNVTKVDMSDHPDSIFAVNPLMPMIIGVIFCVLLIVIIVFHSFISHNRF